MFKGMLRVLFVGTLLYGLFEVHTAQASKRTISLGASDVTTYTPTGADLGKYYTFQFQLPSDIQAGNLEIATLEFYVDVQAFRRGEWQMLDKDSVETIGFLNNTPALELYPLKSAFSGQVDFAQFDEKFRVVRQLIVGNDKRVVMDVTSVVRSYLRSPSKNHGFVVGSLSEMREGDFTIRTGILSPGCAAQIHIYYYPRARQ